MPIGVGLVGAGKHGQRYLHHVRADVPALRLAALARHDVDTGAAQARELGCRFHADWQALVADPAVDAVIAAVPPTIHPELARAVAAARKPLLIEKPLATTGAAAVEIVRTLRAGGVPCLMAHTLRWNAMVQALREHLPALGPLRAVVLNQRFEPSSLAWLDDPAMSPAGLVGHTGVHSFDLVRFLTGGDVARVWCRDARVDTRRTTDNFHALLELAGGGPLVTVTGSRSTLGRSGMIDIAGAAGQLVGDHALWFAYRVHGTERTPLPLPEPVPTVREVLRAFVRLIETGERPLAEIEDGARAVQIAEACRRSAEADGAQVPVDPLP